jgi:hypothetical protein
MNSCFVSLSPYAQCYKRGGPIQTGTLISYSIRLPARRGERGKAMLPKMTRSLCRADTRTPPAGDPMRAGSEGAPSPDRDHQGGFTGLTTHFAGFLIRDCPLADRHRQWNTGCRDRPVAAVYDRIPQVFPRAAHSATRTGPRQTRRLAVRERLPQPNGARLSGRAAAVSMFVRRRIAQTRIGQ